MSLLSDTQNCGLRMHLECWERFPRYRPQTKPLVIHPGMHHSTSVMHVPRCMSGSLTRGVGENVPAIPGACATGNFAYLVRGLTGDGMTGTWVQLNRLFKPKHGWVKFHNSCGYDYFMMTSSNGNIFRVIGTLCGEFTGPGEFPTQRPVTRSFDVFFDLRLNKRFSKQPWGWWFETPSWSLWR